MTVEQYEKAVVEQAERSAEHRRQQVVSGMIPIIGRTAKGELVWYTGKSGADYVSTEYQDAFLGFNLDGARRKAKILNLSEDEGRGIWFMGCNGDLLDLFRFPEGSPEHAQALLMMWRMQGR